LWRFCEAGLPLFMIGGIGHHAFFNEDSGWQWPMTGLLGNGPWNSSPNMRRSIRAIASCFPNY
jgi:hypothetical protein